MWGGLKLVCLTLHSTFALAKNFVKMKNISILIFFVSPFYFQAQSIPPLWVQTEDTDGSLGQGRLPIVLVDAFHNVIVCGDTYSPGPLTGFITTKYDKNGELLWQRHHDTFATDMITSAVTDSTGAVYVGGNSTDPFTNQTQFIVFKYGADGDTLWQYSFNLIPNSTTSLSTLLLDASQNLLILGSYYHTPSAGSGLLAIKVDPSGNIFWEKTYNEGDYGYSGLNARLVGNQFAFWGRKGAPDGIRFFVWQVSLDGETLGTAFTEPYSDYFEQNYYIDKAGSLYIGYYAGQYKVTKFNIEGQTEWVYEKTITQTNPNGVSARLRCISADSSGYVYVSGMYYINDTLGLIGLTSKLDASGGLVFEQMFYFPGYKTVGPYKSEWINNDLLLITGTISIDIDSNFYEYFLAFYDKNGYVHGGVSDIQGRRNWPASIAPNSDYFYIAGQADPEFILTEPRKQFLCKYALDDIIVATSSPGSAKVVGRLSVSPNPFYDNLRVSVHHEGENEQGLLEVHDPQGKVISSKSILLAPGENTLELEGLGNLPAGVYNISLVAARGVYVGQAIKAR